MLIEPGSTTIWVEFQWVCPWFSWRGSTASRGWCPAGLWAWSWLRWPGGGSIAIWGICAVRGGWKARVIGSGRLFGCACRGWGGGNKSCRFRGCCYAGRVIAIIWARKVGFWLSFSGCGGLSCNRDSQDSRRLSFSWAIRQRLYLWLEWWSNSWNSSCSLPYFPTT